MLYPENSIDLLNSEGCILSAKKVSGLWSFDFYNSKVSKITTPKQILDFLSGKKPLIHEDKMYIWDTYTDDMKPSPEKLSEFVVTLMKEEMETCKNDMDYFYKTYYAK